MEGTGALLQDEVEETHATSEEYGCSPSVGCVNVDATWTDLRAE